MKERIGRDILRHEKRAQEIFAGYCGDRLRDSVSVLRGAGVRTVRDPVVQHLIGKHLPQSRRNRHDDGRTQTRNARHLQGVRQTVSDRRTLRVP